MSTGYVGNGVIGGTGVEVISPVGEVTSSVVGNGTWVASRISLETGSFGGAGSVGLGFLSSSSSGMLFCGDLALGSRFCRGFFPFPVGAV